MSHSRFRITGFLKLTLNLKKAVRFVWESGPRWVFLNIGFLIVQGLLPLASLYTMKLMIDAVSRTLAAPPASRSVQPVLQVLILAAIVALIIAVVSRIGETVTKLQGWAVFDYMNDVLQAKGIDADLEYYENAQYQDTLHRAQREAGYRPVSILNGLVQIVQSSISLIGIGWLLITLHWLVIPVLLLAVFPGIVVKLIYSNQQYKLERQNTPKERRSWYYHMILVGADFAKEVRIFGLGGTLRKRYQALRQEIRTTKTRVELTNTYLSIAAQIISTVAVYGLFGYVAYRTIQGSNTLGDLVMYFQAFQRGQGYLQDILGGLARLYENNLFLTNLYEFLDLKKKVPEPEQPLPIPNPIRKGIRFDHVSFNYPNSMRTVLHNIDLAIQPGEVVALVGENGSGKTTLVKLLCRLYDPEAGCIQVDGVDLRQFKIAELRHEIGVIFQDYAQYNLTAGDNIWFGDVAQPWSLEEIVEAARLADAHPVISSLKDGYNTVLGNMFENGEQLSIGQWQKVALARAFYRHSQVIILDEPTSALDPKAEYELFLKFRELLNGRTAILISHRLSTVRMADRIYVIQNGRIVEAGTHEQLMGSAGLYAELFDRQAQSYR
jgi:ATP-binding cassette, subfamily B, bacterial